jgi:DNA-binding transcriptional regulator YiaG
MTKENNPPTAPKIPTPEQIKQARQQAGLTQTAAGALIYKSLRAWQQYEAGDRKMDAALWELFQIKLVRR